jgi:flagellar protein FliS
MQRDNYLQSKVLTAPAHRLHLMLVEGAIRFGRQADQAMQRGDFAAAAAPLMRMIDVVGEMLVGVRHSKTDLNRKIADFYHFLFRRVTEARVRDDAAALAEALQLLEYERETWQMVCDKLGSDGPRDEPANAATNSANAAPRKSSPKAPIFSATNAAASSISLEA